MIVPAGGLVTALDPVLQACGGLWVAHGAGDADRQTPTTTGGSPFRLRTDGIRCTTCGSRARRSRGTTTACPMRDCGLCVTWPTNGPCSRRPTGNNTSEPIDDSRIAFSRKLARVRRACSFRTISSRWCRPCSRPPVRTSRSGSLWHIPWPNPEAFRICPWRTEILQGMLGADIVGFHLQQYCNNFLDTVDRMVEARLDWDHFAVELKGHTRTCGHSRSASKRGTGAMSPAAPRDRGADRAAPRTAQARIHAHCRRSRAHQDYAKGLPERDRGLPEPSGKSS